MASDLELPAIYSIVNAIRPGDPGPKSIIERPPPCPKCGLPYREVVTHLELLLDSPEKFDFGIVGDVFVVSPRLCTELEANHVTGIRFQPMEVGPSENFDPADYDQLPQLVQLSILDTVDGPSGWWTKEGVCPLCGRPIWGGGDGAAEALSSVPNELLGPPREICGAAWQGEDMFWTVDPGPALLTKRVKQILEPLKTPELILHPAKFV